MIPKQLSASGRGAYMDCPQLYKYRYLDKIQPMTYERALVAGSIGHIFLEGFYGGRTLVESLEEINRRVLEAEWDYASMQQFETDLYAMTGMAEAYSIIYQADLEKFKKIDIEKEVSRPAAPGCFFGDMGFTDIVCEIYGDLWVMDHKFLRKVPDALIRRLPLDTQIQMYIRMVQHTYQRPVKGVIYNVIKKTGKRVKKNQSVAEYQREIHDDYLAKPDEFFFREEVVLTTEQLQDYDAQHVLIDQMIRRSYIDRSWHRNTKHCDKYGKPCAFMPICLDGMEASKLFYKPKGKMKR